VATWQHPSINLPACGPICQALTGRSPFGQVTGLGWTLYPVLLITLKWRRLRFRAATQLDENGREPGSA
jgi:hypothetical protein